MSCGHTAAEHEAMIDRILSRHQELRQDMETQVLAELREDREIV